MARVNFKNNRKFVVWGCGLRSYWLRRWLGRENIVAYIESDPSKLGINDYYTPVISLDEYLISWSDYPIIISPKNYEDEISNVLESRGVYWYFKLSESLGVETFLFQADIDKLLIEISDNTEICVYGYTLLGLLLYDYFSQNGYKTELLIQNNIRDKIFLHISKDYLKWTTIEETRAKTTILAMEVQPEDDFAFSHRFKLYHWENLTYRKDICGNSDLESFKNIHCGERLFIVATGPSLIKGDLDTLYEHDEISISVNGIVFGLSNTKWRPTYYTVSDPLAVEIYKDEMIRLQSKKKFISDIAWDDAFDHDNSFIKWHYIREPYTDELPRFSDDFSRGAYFGYTVVYEGALQLACYMGVKEIYLLGVDTSKGNSTKHFYDNQSTCCTGKSNIHMSYEQLTKAYLSAKDYAEKHGISIFNATRGGELEIFERVDFDSLFD